MYNCHENTVIWKKYKKAILAAVFVLAIAISFGFSHVKKASAQSAKLWCGHIDKGHDVTARAQNNIGVYQFDAVAKEVNNEEECKNICSSDPEYLVGCKTFGTNEEARDYANTLLKNSGADPKTGIVGTGKDVCDIGLLDFLSVSKLVNCILLYVLRFLGMFLEMTSALFTWVLNTKNMTDVLSNPIIYEIWMVVRDFLNVSFILVLLFSAFCTVFQVDKFNYKKILLTLIIMALLVNFSFPIARVIIDFSNVVMYYLIKTLGFDNGPGYYFAHIATDTPFQNLIIPPNNVNSDTAYLISAVVFVFIFAVTLVIISVLFLIRIIALAILIIFSSVAFVGSIVPFLSSQASKWWDALFKYSFFGPIMIFMLVVAKKIMDATALNGLGNMYQIAQANSANDPGFIAAAAYFAIPIVVLWMGIAFAQQMSIIGAGAVVGRGQKFMASVGGWTAKAPFKGAWWGAKKTGVPGATKQRWDQWKTEGALGSERTSQREAKLAAKFGVKGAEEKDMKRRAEELKKKIILPDELKEMASKGDAAAAYRLFEENEMDDNTYNKFMSSKSSSTLKEAVSKKAKQNRADLAINYKAKKEAAKKVEEELAINPSLTLTQQNNIRFNEEQRIKKEEISKLSVENWQKQNWKDVIDKNPDMHDYIKDSFIKMTNEAKIEVAKTLHDQKATALRSIHVPV